MTKRRTWTAKRRLALFEAHDGICYLCGRKIDGTREAWDVEHIIPLAMDGEDDESNCAPAHRACHKAKTAKDVRQIAKASRVRAKHNGARKRSTFQTSRDGPFKAKIGGGIEPRN